MNDTKAGSHEGADEIKTGQRHEPKRRTGAKAKANGNGHAPPNDEAAK
jgi:hypothetical protein